VIPKEARCTLEGVMSSVIATIAQDGTPNIAYVSQVWYVDATHVAVSHQFFNKTMHNIREVPYAMAQTFDPRTLAMWIFRLRHVETQQDGPVFEQMEMQLEALGAITGTAGLWNLKAAEIFEVEAVSSTAVQLPAPPVNVG
jgi:adenylate cyclase